MPGYDENPEGFLSEPEIAAATVESIRSGLKFYDIALDPEVAETVKELVRTGYGRAGREGKLVLFPAAAHKLSRRVVEGLIADIGMANIVAPEREARSITDATTLRMSVCDVLPVWPFCS